MKLSIRCLGSVLVTAAGSLALASCMSPSAATGGVQTAPVAAHPLPVATQQPESQRIAVSPIVAEALAALDRHSSQVMHRDRIGVVDFSLPSSEPRFHIVDVATGRIEASWLVAHGSGSDPQGTGMVQSFSNAPGSHATSRGAYLTAEPYTGKYGRSQRLIGLDAENDRAMDRAIVIHGAPYVDPALIPRQGRIGRSQGCFAFELDQVGVVMDRLGVGRLIYAGKPA